MGKKTLVKIKLFQGIVLFIVMGLFVLTIFFVMGKATRYPAVVDRLDIKISSFSNTTSQKGVQDLVSGISHDIEELKQTLSDQRTSLLASSGILFFVFFGGIISMLYLFFPKKYASQVDEIIHQTEIIAKGNVNVHFETNQTGLMGKLTGSLERMVRSLYTTMLKISGFIESLTFSSNELGVVFKQMSENTQTTFEKTDKVSSFSNEMSTKMSAIASAMEQSANSVTEVANNIEEMNGSINEAYKFAEKTDATTKQVVIQAGTASENIEALGRAADKIGQVTETISNISSQTNLLALNATIEAARAGESGKGFAVVANEIKVLAGQTAEATNDIGAKITDIRSTIQTSVEEITHISSAINNVSETVSSMVTIIEKQSETAQTVTKNIQQAAYGINDINENVSQSSAAANQITIEIKELSSLAVDMKASGDKIRTNSDELNKLADKFKNIFSSIEFGQAEVTSTKEEAKTLVESGLDHLSQNGKKSSFSKFNDSNGGFIKDDLYLYAIDYEGTFLVSGSNNSLIGKNLYSALDVDGNPFIKNIIDTARKEDKGWVKYKWSHPETRQIMDKVAYVSLIPGEDIVLGCGVYET